MSSAHSMSRATRTHATVRALCIGSALGALALCGSAGAGGASASTKPINLQSAYHATVGATSSKETINEVMQSAGRRQTLTGSGVADAQGNGSFSLNAAGQSVDMVIDNGVLYLKLPTASTAPLNVTTPWVSLNLSTLTQAKLGESYQQLVSDGQQGPTTSLALLETASSSGVHKVGTTTLYGSSTTEYKTTIDLNKVASASGKPALAPAIEKLESEYHLSLIPVTVWLDGQNRVRRLVENVNIPSAASHPSASAVITVDLTAFDVPVTVTPPAAGQFTDITAQAVSSATTA
jgi:hypothetical protein